MTIIMGSNIVLKKYYFYNIIMHTIGNTFVPILYFYNILKATDVCNTYVFIYSCIKYINW